MQALRFSAIATAALLLASAPVSAQTVPSASDVLAKYVAAIGGKDAIMKITSLKQTSTMQVPAVGLTAEIEAYQAAPNKMATKSTIPGVGEMLQGTDGVVAWDANPMQGPRLLSDKELAQTLEGADFYGNMLYPADRFSTMENLGVADFNGERSYKVKLVRKDSGRLAARRGGPRATRAPPRPQPRRTGRAPRRGPGPRRSSLRPAVELVEQRVEAPADGEAEHRRAPPPAARRAGRFAARHALDHPVELVEVFGV
jgi:hypothetical protein